MPRALKFIYIGVAILAAAAFAVGLFDVLLGADERSELGRDVILPLAIFGIVILLYRRRKREMEAKSRPNPPI
ncbi:MAG: hypothetical protein WD275_03025 [Rhodothermales bacterium]